MRKLVLFLFLACGSAYAQTYGLMQFQLQTAQGQAVSGATVNVYTQTGGCGGAQSSLATLYPAATGGTPLTQPLTTNGFGYANAYAAQGCYTVVYYSPYTGTLTFADQNAIPASAVTPASGNPPANAPLLGTTSGAALQSITLGTNLSLSGTTLNATSGALPANANLVGTVGTTGRAIAAGPGTSIDTVPELVAASATSSQNGSNIDGDSVCAGTGQISPGTQAWPYLMAAATSGGVIVNNCFGGTNWQASNWYHYAKITAWPGDTGNPIYIDAGGRNNTNYTTSLTANQLTDLTRTGTAHALATAAATANIQPFSYYAAATPTLSSGNITAISITNYGWVTSAPTCWITGGAPSLTVNTCATSIGATIASQYPGVGYSGTGTCSVDGGTASTAATCSATVSGQGLTFSITNSGSDAYSVAPTGISVSGFTATSVVSATSPSGVTFTGTGSCALGSFNNSSNATASIAIASGVAGAITITNENYGATAAPTSATVGSCTGTASGTGTLTFTSTLGFSSPAIANMGETLTASVSGTGTYTTTPAVILSTANGQSGWVPSGTWAYQQMHMNSQLSSGGAGYVVGDVYPLEGACGNITVTSVGTNGALVGYYFTGQLNSQNCTLDTDGHFPKTGSIISGTGSGTGAVIDMFGWGQPLLTAVSTTNGNCMTTATQANNYIATPGGSAPTGSTNQIYVGPAGGVAVTYVSWPSSNASGTTGASFTVTDVGGLGLLTDQITGSSTISTTQIGDQSTFTDSQGVSESAAVFTGLTPGMHEIQVCQASSGSLYLDNLVTSPSYPASNVDGPNAWYVNPIPWPGNAYAANTKAVSGAGLAAVQLLNNDMGMNNVHFIDLVRWNNATPPVSQTFDLPRHVSLNYPNYPTNNGMYTPPSGTYVQGCLEPSANGHPTDCGHRFIYQLVAQAIGAQPGASSASSGFLSTAALGINPTVPTAFGWNNTGFGYGAAALGVNCGMPASNTMLIGCYNGSFSGAFFTGISGGSTTGTTGTTELTLDRFGGITGQGSITEYGSGANFLAGVLTLNANALNLNGTGNSQGLISCQGGKVSEYGCGIQYNKQTSGEITAAVYSSGGSFPASGSGTCALTNFNHGSTAIGSIAYSGGTGGTITMSNYGGSATAAATTASLGSPCFGTATITSTWTGTTNAWLAEMDSAYTYRIYDQTNSINRFSAVSTTNGATEIDSEGTGPVRVNYSNTAGIGTGGLCIGDNDNTCHASISGAGALTVASCSGCVGSNAVTSVATTSPITGGTITTTGTIACATCVVATSPGAGIAHFAGSTQTVTSSAVSLTADVSGTLPMANGGTGTNLTCVAGGFQYGASTTTTGCTTYTANTIYKEASTAVAPVASALSDNGTTVSSSEPFTSSGAITSGNTSQFDIGNRANFSSSATGVINAGTGITGGTGGYVVAVAFESGGTKFTATGCTSITSTVGGATAGKFTIGAATCTVVITMNGATGLTANNGYSCHANDETTAAGNTGLYFSTNGTTTATLTVPATAAASDVIDFACTPF